MAHNEHQQRVAAWQAEQQEIEAVWMFLRDRGNSAISAEQLLADVVRMLRNRAIVWQVQGETELFRECHAIASILEGRAGGAEQPSHTRCASPSFDASQSLSKSSG